MSFTKKAQDYLDKCKSRVIGFDEVKEGIVVYATYSGEYRVSKFTLKNSSVDEERIDEFSLGDFCGKDDSETVLNFKKLVSDIVGRKKYYIETGIYKVLANEDIDPDEFDDDADDFDTAEERAMREAEEEEAAEHNFERFLKNMEEM